MSNSTAQNMIIGRIDHVETVTDAGFPNTTITLNHLFWERNYKYETAYRFTFHNVPENHMHAYQEGNLVMVQYELTRGDNYDYKLTSPHLTYLGEADPNTETMAFNHITGIIGTNRHGEYKHKSYVQISIPHEKYDRGNNETLWLNFSFWRVHPDLHFLYEKGCAVSLDYNLVNKEDGTYDIRPKDRLNLIKGNPKNQATASGKKTRTRKKTTA